MNRKDGNMVDVLGGVHPIELVMLLVTTFGWLYGYREVRHVTARRELAESIGIDPRALIAAYASEEHETWRLGKQSLFLVAALYCLLETPPPPAMTMESLVLRTLVCCVSIIMSITTRRSRMYTGRIVGYGTHREVSQALDLYHGESRTPAKREGD
jgi:hypothetical protein